MILRTYLFENKIYYYYHKREKSVKIEHMTMIYGNENDLCIGDILFTLRILNKRLKQQKPALNETATVTYRLFIELKAKHMNFTKFIYWYIEM